MSDDLIAFLKAWHDWATNGAPSGKPFSRGHGLCGNALRFCSDEERGERLWDELSAAFHCGSYEDPCYPFGYAQYNSREWAGTQHECPQRLAWVREKLVEAGELVA